MENNFLDKGLRDKLQGVEVPFDPAAWEQMEQKLDEKKKRRFVFWWATMSGIAALLVLGIVGYKWNEGSENSVSGSKKLEVRNENKGLESNIQNIPNQNEETNPQVSMAPSTNENKHNLSLTESVAKASSVRRNRKTGISNAPVVAVAGTNLSNPNSFSSFTRESSRIKAREAKALAAFKQENKEQERTLLAAIIHESMGADKLMTPDEVNEINLEKKKEEEFQSKKKKKTLSYSLGVLANTTWTIPGNTSVQPSYMVGGTHDLLIANRFALSNSILYSGTSFSIDSPKTVSFTKTPLEYSSKISEMAITIGIKGYPVSKEKFRFYLAAGIINHIKITETFHYKTAPAPTTIPSGTPTGTLYDSLPFPTSTNFSNATSKDMLTNSPGGAIENANGNTADFSMNKAVRYYTSFYASAGAEFIFKKHFIVFAEPLYYMSLQKIGVQDKRKYNFGLSAGGRFQF